MTAPRSAPDPVAVESYLRDLQSRLVRALEALEPDGARFVVDDWEKPADAALQGRGRTCVIEDGAVFERGGVAFSDVRGERLPPSASAQRPELAGRGFRAMGVSLVMHPRNPHVPTAHLNVRFFVAHRAGADDPADAVWWFGGGFDLTPYYGYDEDCRHWHAEARSALIPFEDEPGSHALHARFKRQCDDYFFLKHRGEPRGIGGLFFDDWNRGGFDASFALMRSVGERFLPAYRPIVERRRDTSFGARERDWQLARRGRYVEFNLVWDRGTLFGLQSGGRSESILMSMPPLAAWRYRQAPEPGSAEARLLEHFLRPRDWT